MNKIQDNGKKICPIRGAMIPVPDMLDPHKMRMHRIEAECEKENCALWVTRTDSNAEINSGKTISQCGIIHHFV